MPWIEPTLLCEVAFTEWTEDGHIRHPSFQGLREDKDAGEVKKEMPAKTTAKAGSLVLSGIAITHPDRVISQAGHITKGDPLLNTTPAWPVSSCLISSGGR